MLQEYVLKRVSVGQRLHQRTETRVCIFPGPRRMQCKELNFLCVSEVTAITFNKHSSDLVVECSLETEGLQV